jgi:predicted nucleotidyltransferase component of viral defense system
VKRASKDALAGRRYLDLQREAKRTGRPTDELIQLYALECFLDRLVHSKFADTFILKGGVLLAALDARRPTRDIDFAARAIENTTEKVLSAVQTIAAISIEDGMELDSNARPPRPSASKITTAKFVSRLAEHSREPRFDSTWTSISAIPFGRGRSRLASRV